MPRQRLALKLPILAALAVAMLAAVSTASRAAPEAAPSRVMPPEIILKSQLPPEYPPAARAARISGTVMLEIHVAKDGTVRDVDVLDCTHRKVGFEEAATSAVSKWVYIPAHLENEPIEDSLKYRLNFNYGPAGTATVSGGQGDPDGGGAASAVRSESSPTSSIPTVSTRTK